MKHALMTGLCLFALAACDNKPAGDTKPDDPAKNSTTTTNATAAVATTATPTPVPAPVTISESDLSTPADFEEAAEKSITAKTYKAELAMLETDLAKE